MLGRSAAAKHICATATTKQRVNCAADKKPHSALRAELTRGWQPGSKPYIESDQTGILSFFHSAEKCSFIRFGRVVDSRVHLQALLYQSYVIMSGLTNGETSSREFLLEKLATSRGHKRVECLHALASTDGQDQDVNLQFLNEAAELLGGHEIAIRNIKSRRHAALIVDNLMLRLNHTRKTQGFDAALPLAHSAELIATEFKDVYRRIKALIQVGRTQYKLGKAREAIDTLQKCHQLNDAEQNQALSAEINRQLAEILAIQGDSKTALQLLEQAMTIRRSLHDRAGEGELFNLMGHAHYFCGDYGAALPCFQQYKTICTELGDASGGATADNNIGLVLQWLGDYGAALDHYFAALRHSESINDLQAVAEMGRNIGVVYERMERRDEALEFLFKSLHLAEQIANDFERAVTYANIANVYKTENTRDANLRALEFYHKALDINVRLGDRRYEATQLVNISQVYTFLEQFDEALPYCSRALTMFEEFDDNWGRILTLIELASCERGLQLTTDAESHLHTALELAKESRSNDLQYRVHSALVELYRHTGNYERALTHYEQFHKCKESLFNEQADLRTKNLHILHDMEQKAREHEVIRLQNEKLGADVEAKTKELTTKAMYLSQKNDILSKVKRDLNKLAQSGGSVSAAQILAVGDQIDEVINDEQSWEGFEAQFSALHPDFVHKLSTAFPALSPTEIKVCTLIMLNLSAKESARILNVSGRSIGQYRYRIRHKLGLDPSQNLPNFLAGI